MGEWLLREVGFAGLRLNTKLRDELLNLEVFSSLREAEVLIESWRQHSLDDALLPAQARARHGAKADSPLTLQPDHPLGQTSLKRDPNGGDLYVLLGRRADLCKILCHDDLGMSLYAKRLERGRFSRAPSQRYSPDAYSFGRGPRRSSPPDD